MDSFEQIICELFWNKGFWVWNSFKVKLTKEDKIKINRHSCPRWELDIVAYDAPKNVIHVIECKSFLDSGGVGTQWIDGEKRPGFLKLFRQPELREVVLNRLSSQFIHEGRCRSNPKMRLGLACGHIKKKHRHELQDHFRQSGWDLYDEEWIRNGLKDLTKGGYENNIASVVAKLTLGKGLPTLPNGEA